TPAAAIVPGAASTPAAAMPASYVVQPGGTLSEIAERFGTSVDALMSANGIVDARLVRIGVSLAVPGTSAPPAATAPTAAAAPTAPAARARTYTVRPGDALSEIAERLGTSTAALARANRITDAHRVRIGTVLAIP
ncbi:MAG: LysM domain-containing protein, partial [Chloroflexi bacterium]|nr:LysM domain-containing protein [Chloroflexota bacterium]